MKILKKLSLKKLSKGYIDPGSGSFILQLVIGGGLAAVYTVKRYWKNISVYVRAKCSRKK